MGIIKKIFYYLRLTAALILFLAFIVIIAGFITGNNYFNIPYEEIQSYIMQDLKGNTIKFLGLIAIVTLIFGRIWCSLICPIGTFQEIIFLVSRRPMEKRKSYYHKYILLALLIICGYFFHPQIVNFIINNQKILLWAGIISLLPIAVLTVFKGRFFCSDICPFGALYGLIAKLSIFKIHQGDGCMCCTMCEEVCPTGCIDTCDEKVNNVTCVKCLRCFSACSENGMKYGIKLWKK